jgi:hypothetical protein
MMFATRGQSALEVQSGQYSIGFSSVAEAFFAAAEGNSQIRIDGGAFSVLSEDNLIPSMIQIAHASDSATISIRGGTSDLPGDMSSASVVHLNSLDQATINVYGTGFNHPYGPLVDLEGTLTGQLDDGSAIEWRFVRDSTARIVLIPEPTSVVLLAFAIASWTATTARRRTDIASTSNGRNA